MAAGTFDDILLNEGFREIGSLHFRMQLSLWWHSEHRIQIVIFPVGSKAILKGMKSYFMKSISEDGETYARDIPQLQQYLEAHFDELRISFSHFRDISKTIAKHHIKKTTRIKTPTLDIPTADDLARVQQALDDVRSESSVFSAFTEYCGGSSDMLETYISGAAHTRQRRASDLETKKRETKDRLELFKHLQSEYEHRGSAATFSFSINSNVQMATSPQEFRDALTSIIKELTDLHRYQVSQKLNGGRLNIHVEEAHLPEYTWFEEWMGGSLSPRAIERLTAEFTMLKEAASERLMVTPKEDIRVEGNIKEHRKLLGARIASTLLCRLDSEDELNRSKRDVSKAAHPLRLGRIMLKDRFTQDDFLLPLAEAKHIYVSGTTGSGKSYVGRVIVEEACQYKDLNILVLDPRNQWAGILIPEDRDKILDLYEKFDLNHKDARGFCFKYYCPGFRVGDPLPGDLGDLSNGQHVISFKGLDDKQRCSLFADILNKSFERTTKSESEVPRLLIIVEEAHRFTRKRVDETAKAEASRAEITLDRVVREGRKFGCCVVILSQTIRDFAYDSASIRQNTNTKIFLHNSDREMEYAATFLGDGKQIIQLPPATALIHNPAWGVAKVRIRPPLSKVWEFSPEETARLVNDPLAPVKTVSKDAQNLLVVIQRQYQECGSGLKVGELSELAEITSKRRMKSLLNELENARLITSTYLSERGKPRIIEPVLPVAMDEPPPPEPPESPESLDKTPVNSPDITPDESRTIEEAIQ